MANPLFDKLKEEFAANPEAWIDRIGLNVRSCTTPGIIHSDHTCDPQESAHGADFCTWFEDGGNFQCKKCGEKSTDITDSYRLIKKIEGDHSMTAAAQELADLMGVTYQKYDPSKKGRAYFDSLPECMSPKFLEDSRKRLLSPDGEECREFIESKWKCDIDEAVELGLGCWRQHKRMVITFAFFDEQTGKLHPRFKHQRPADGSKRKWNTVKDSKAPRPPRLYPQIAPNELTEEFVILEGESDLITARCRLKWQELGVYPIAVAMGKMGRIQKDAFPKALDGKKVTIMWDLDAFQGPLQEVKGDDKQKEIVRASTLGPVHDLCLRLRERNCDVHLAAIPLDPVEHPKGDLTDWVNLARGRVPSDVPSWTYEEIYREINEVKQVATVAEAMSASWNTRISVVGVVAALDQESTVVIPRRTVTTCPQGEPEFEAKCKTCGLPERLGFEQTNVVPWDQYPGQRARMMFSRSPDVILEREVVQKNKSCNRLTMVNTDLSVGSKWILSDTDGGVDEGIMVISDGRHPDVVGRVRVTGRVHDINGKFGLVADRVEQLDANTVDLEPHLFDLKTKFPHGTNDLKILQEAVERIATSLSDHVTNAYQRIDLHIGTLVGLCTARRFMMDGRETRGWIDACIMGLQRQGKTKVVEELFKALGMGHFSQANSSMTSRAGLVASSDNMKSVKPGTWPKHHGRAVALDEMQTYFGNSVGGQVMDALQSARSNGYVDSAKCTGDTRLKAEVRSFFISNFPKGDPRYTCENLEPLFRKPESISRLDFALFVKNRVAPDGYKPTGLPETHPIDLIRVLVQRAWAQEPHEVVVTKAALDKARAKCEAWDAKGYDLERIPLFTGIEKVDSIIRIAIGVANLVFSHPSEDAECRSVEVRPVHVEWACEWLEHTWRESGYDRYSEAIERQHRVANGISAAAWLTEGIKVHEVEQSLGPLLDVVDLREAQNFMPRAGFREQQGMLAALFRHRVLMRMRVDGKTCVAPTRGGKELIQRIIKLAEEHEDNFETVAGQWAQWRSEPGLMSVAPPDFSDESEFDLWQINEQKW